jgi:predicted MFS family arabinose efflux permease
MVPVPTETTDDTAPEALRARHAAVAVAALFFVNGATFSNWLPRIPEIRDRLGLDNAGLGATLLGGGLGGILGALTVARVVGPLGSRRLLIAAAAALSIGMPFIALVPVAPLLLALLTLLGTLDVFNDMSMNAQGVMVQQHLGRSIMNRLHAMWSLGFTGGAVIGSAASAAHLDIRIHLGAVGLLLLTTVLVVQRWLVPNDAPVEPKPEAAPGPRRFATSPAMVAMAFAALAAISLEVLPNDWSAVLMRDVFKAGRFSGLGTVACAGAMLVGRLGGDHVLDRVGEDRLLRGALVVVAAGTVITVTAPVTALAVVGLVVWGLGLSVVFPQLYATAARLPGTSAGAGLGSMLLGQRVGAMLTAIGTGALAEWADLRFAFAVVTVIAFAVLSVTLHRASAAKHAPTT